MITRDGREYTEFCIETNSGELKELLFEKVDNCKTEEETENLLKAYHVVDSKIRERERQFCNRLTSY